ncbi:hypothetical protein HWV62_14032 [Athelia sp. TMB]|nr:hypothetical protein HWV62_14032 [Athelia sp. TMB]
MSSTDQPPSKRKRDETSSQEEEISLLADPVQSDIWYDDGNIILQAENTRFKVYRGILMENSTVFRDMFSMPQPSTGETDMVEGCSLVRLHDSAEEVGYMLDALFRHRYLTSDDKMTFPVLAALLCLGRKYNIRKMQLEARKRIYSRYPTSLKEYDAAVRKWIGLEPPAHSKLCSVLTIARRAGLLSILPAVFYACCVTYSVSAVATKPAFCLLPSDQITCLAGRHAMYDAQAETTFAWVYTAQTLDPNCSSPKRCHQARQKCLIDRFLPTPKDFGLDKWSYTSVYIDGKLCEECMEAAQEKHEAGRAAFWERLPTLFNLPPWAELSKEREETD